MELKGIAKSYGDAQRLRRREPRHRQGGPDRVRRRQRRGEIDARADPRGDRAVRRSGSGVVGHNVTISYFAQHQAEELNPAYDVLQTVDEVATGDIRRRLRTLLGCFLFSGDDVFKKVRVLSGGEKSRLALAKMLLQPSNLIVMDEPTNHLDMRSKGVLQEALETYEGSFVIVSHDRDFLDPIVTKVVDFRRGGIKVYPGNVSDYIDARAKELQGAVPSSQGKTPTGAQNEKERKRLEAEERQKRYRKTKPLRDAIDKLERKSRGDGEGEERA